MRPRALVLAALAAVLAAGPAASSERVDRAVAELKDLVATDDVNRIAKAFVDSYLALAEETGKLSPEALEAAEAYGALLMEGKLPQIATAFYKRALALRRIEAPEAEATARAGHRYAVALYQSDQEDQIEPVLAEAFRIWRALGDGSPEAVESGLYLAKARARAGDPAAAADLFAAALALSATAELQRTRKLRQETVEAAEEAFTAPAAWADPAVARARAAVLEAYGDAGARQAIAFQRRLLARPDSDREADIVAQARIAEILARWMADDAAARRDTARERARLLYIAGRTFDADAAYREAIVQAERVAGPEGIEVADLLVDAGENLALSAASLELQRRAEADFARALAIRDKRLAPNDRRIAIAAMRLAFVYHFSNLAGGTARPAEVEPLLLKARAVLDAAAEPDHALRSDLHLQFVQLYWGTGRHREAVAEARAAVREADALGDPTQRLVARSQLFSALPPEASAEEEALLDEKIALAEQLADTRPHWLMGALADRAQYDLAIGRYASADRVARRAAALGLDTRDREAISTLEILARVARFFGRNEVAAELYDRAATIAETTAQNVPDRLTALRLRAAAAVRRDDYAGARDHLARMVALQTETFGADDPSNADAHTQLGLALWNAGDLAAAEPELRRALALESRVNGPQSGVAGKRADLARLLTARGRFDEAIALFAETERDYAATGVASDPTRAQVAALQADALVRAGRPAEALAAARRAAAIVTRRIAEPVADSDPSAASVRDAEVRRSSAIFVSQVRAAHAAATAR